jgi:hypothetical protein
VTGAPSLDTACRCPDRGVAPARLTEQMAALIGNRMVFDPGIHRHRATWQPSRQIFEALASLARNER